MSADRAGVVDYLVNAFTPDRRAVWDDAITTNRLAIKVRRDDADGFVEPPAMVERMDELGIATILLPAGDISRHGERNRLDFDHLASRWDEVARLAERWPGRFAAYAVIDPEQGMAAVQRTRRRLDDPWVVGLYLHTHSWDRRLDHADYYPYYALCAELDVPVAMQAGASGGLMPSECARPFALDRAALYFPETRFVLSHTGWPWVDEAVAMAMKFANVFVGTGSWPPRRWPPVLRELIAGPGAGKVLFGTNFPTVGHRQALGQIADLALGPEAEEALLAGTARTVFTRLRPGDAP